MTDRRPAEQNALWIGGEWRERLKRSVRRVYHVYHDYISETETSALGRVLVWRHARINYTPRRLTASTFEVNGTLGRQSAPQPTPNDITDVGTADESTHGLRSTKGSYRVGAMGAHAPIILYRPPNFWNLIVKVYQRWSVLLLLRVPWTAKKQRLHLHSAAGISRHSA